MKLTEKLWEMWHYDRYGSVNVDPSVGHSLGWDMFHTNLRTGRENYPSANVHLNWTVLARDWAAMGAANQQEAIKHFRDVEAKCMDELREKFAANDRTGFYEVVAAAEAELDAEKETPETGNPGKKSAAKKGGK